MTVMVIDGNSIVNRAFFGIRMLNAPDGTPTNGIYGFLSILRRVMNDVRPDALAVAFDLHGPTFRKLKYDAYKAQRKGMPEELAVQMPILKEVLDAMNVSRCELSGWEADDLLGTISKKCAERGDRCVLVTGDRDSFQLIGGGTEVYHIKSRMGQTEVKVYDEEAFREEYGFEPINIIDLKALMGDASDNIPGVPGVGEKTAMDLIQRFTTVDRIYSELDSLDIKDSVKKKLEAGKESAILSYDLATIRCDAPIEINIEDLGLKSVNNDALYALFTRLGFRKLISEYGLSEPAEEKAKPSDLKKPEKWEEYSEKTDELKKSLSGRLCGFRLNEEKTAAALYPEGSDTAYIVSGEALLFALSPEVKKAGFNIKDDIREALRRGATAGGWEFDAALAAYLLDPARSGYGLYELSEDNCGFKIEAGEEGGQLSLLYDEGAELKRLSQEAAACLYLAETLEPRLEAEGLERVFRDIELPLCPVLAKMELAGFLVDKNALSALGAALETEIERLTAEIYSLAGTEFNINSPKQLGEVLFERLMLPAPKKTKTGYSTNADVLEKLKGRHRIIPLVLEYRELSKLKSTYADGLTKMIGADGRIHTTFQMTVTATGRLSSTDPNLQNIPVRRELGGEIRKAFIAPEGMTLVDADYSQIELRILAHISGDEAMIEAYRTGEDIHRLTAASVLGIPPEEVTKEERGKAKAVNFGIVYGISAFSLSDDIGVSVTEARDYINAYMAKYRGVSDYMERTVREAKEKGAAFTEYGRKRPLPELKSSNFNLRSFGERVARNMPIQGTAADIMKIAMINADRALSAECPGARLILQVHDELIAECPEADAEKVAAILKREMEGAAKLSVPLTAEVKCGGTWYEAK
ncbi:MAG: DNA polymerase I [Oscillospiraceae bacterium]|nr:DNA polymerase I [Oscillospiraceae bacterium]